MQEIDFGSGPDTPSGDSLYQGGLKINANFKEVYEITFINAASVRVSRFISDPANQDLTTYRNDDKCEAWTDGTKTVWVEGIILDATGFVFADDWNDTNKFFITNKKTRITI